MKLIDIDGMSLYYGGLVHIYPHDFEGTAKYFVKQIQAMPEVKAIPCEYIREKARNSVGAQSTYLRKLLQDWEKENA